MSMYLRIKRRNQTFFVHAEPTDTIQSLKQEVATQVAQEVASIKLYATPDKSRELVDTAILQEQEIKNDVVLYMVFRDEGGDGWEDIEVANGGASSAEMKS